MSDAKTLKPYMTRALAGFSKLTKAAVADGSAIGLLAIVVREPVAGDPEVIKAVTCFTSKPSDQLRLLASDVALTMAGKTLPFQSDIVEHETRTLNTRKRNK